MVAHKGGGRFDLPRLVGATALQWLCWVAGTLVGLLLRPDPELMKQLGIDVIFPAFFLLLVLDEVRGNRRAAVAALLGAAISGALLLVTEPGYALLAATAGALIGLQPERDPEPDLEDEAV
jgi:predicted branched-subunit amino acid permease